MPPKVPSGPPSAPPPGPAAAKRPEADVAPIRIGLKQVSRSPKPVCETGMVSAIETQRVGDYTIVVIEGSKEIQVFDKEGRKVEDFKPIGNTEVVINWKKIGDSVGKEYLTNQGYSESYRFDISEFPSHLRAFASDALSSLGSRVPFEDIKPQSVDVSGLPVYTATAYICFKKGATVIWFQIKNEQGDLLQPQNWKRIDSSSVGKFPANLEDITPSLKDTDDIKKHPTLPCFIKVTNDGIKIEAIAKQTPQLIFEDNTRGIETNVCVSPANSNVIYYCRSENASCVMELDLNKPQDQIQSRTLHFTGTTHYTSIKNLQIDPTGNFFMFEFSGSVVVVEKKTMAPVFQQKGLSAVNFDAQGRVHAVDKDGHYVVFQQNFGDVYHVREQQVQQHLVAKEETSTKMFSGIIQKTATVADIQKVEGFLGKYEQGLHQQGLSDNDREFMVGRIRQELAQKKSYIVQQEISTRVIRIRTKLGGAMTTRLAAELRRDVDEMEQLAAQTKLAVRPVELVNITGEVGRQVARFFDTQAARIERDVEGVVAGAGTKLQGMGNKHEFDAWVDTELPGLKIQLRRLQDDCPPENTDTYRKIGEAREKLNRLEATYTEKFEREYAAIRTVVQKRVEEKAGVLEKDIKAFTGRFIRKGFRSRAEAEQEMQKNPALAQIREEIKTFEKDDPERARDMNLKLEIEIASALRQIETGSSLRVDASGRQMVLFGQNTYFPRWEGEAKKLQAQRAEPIFIADERTKGAGVTADSIMGDIGFLITTPQGKQLCVRLWERLHGGESKYRYGASGKLIPSSYISKTEYDKIMEAYKDWCKGERSNIKQEIERARAALHQHYAKRKAAFGSGGIDFQAWEQERTKLLGEYTEIYSTRHVALFEQMDTVRKNPAAEFTNGAGVVSEWSPHWVLAPEDEKIQEEIAQMAQMQLDNQEGLINLKGHAGTGKDVHVKIFSNRTNRPYFAIDCSKWTTEFELSEDVVLEAEGGASKTIKVPSVVLNAIQTPGAIMYFNEINAMPEQAQIFLHALFDEKRSLTLKTSSGKVVKAHPSVIFMSSMNPGYPGTFDPQMATRSRMVPIEINYPPLFREKDNADTNPNPPYSASEALKIARSVMSLRETTVDPDMNRNGFVKIWDYHVNGTGADPGMSETQKFDTDVILTLVQFAAKLRENFIAKFEKTRESRNALPVMQPVTLREMRRCAYLLSRMPSEQRARTSSEKVAKDLISRFFLTHIDKKDDREKIAQAMETWTSQKRIRA